MASTANITITETDNINGLSLGQITGTTYSTTPTGSIVLGESIFVGTVAQQVFSGSSGVNISRVTVYNTGTTGSITLSGSGIVINSVINPGQASSIAINGPVPSLYAQSSVGTTTGSFFVIPN